MDLDPSLPILFLSGFRSTRDSISRWASSCLQPSYRMCLRQWECKCWGIVQLRQIWQAFFLSSGVCSSKTYGHFDLYGSSGLITMIKLQGTCGLNCPGPGSSAANFIASSKLLCLIFLSLFLRLENFFVPRSVYLVRSNLPTPGGLCLAQNSSMRSRQVYFLVLRSTVLTDADRCLFFISPSTLYLEGQGFSIVSEATSSKKHILGFVVTLSFYCFGRCLQSSNVLWRICFFGSHQQ